jgi:hypothetical protein
MRITHTYIGTTRNGVRCLFFLLFEDYIEAQYGLSQEIRQEIERFARNMRNFGAVVAPFAGDVSAVRESIMAKQWSKEEKTIVMRTPAILMIDRDFDDFNPRIHPWVLFHLGDDDKGAVKCRSLLHKISDAVATEGADPFEMVRNAMREEVVAAASQIIQLNPGAFGVSLDLRASWEAFKAFLRSRKSMGMGV